jgi:tetratricopeptide (TPR) repeat protein
LQAYFDVGYQYFLQGNKEKALEYFQKALDTKVPDSMST